MHTNLLHKAQFLSKSCLKESPQNILETTCDNLRHWLLVRDIEHPIRGGHKGRLKNSQLLCARFSLLQEFHNDKNKKGSGLGTFPVFVNVEFLSRPLWPPRIGCSISRTDNQCCRLSRVVPKMFLSVFFKTVFRQIM